MSRDSSQLNLHPRRSRCLALGLALLHCGALGAVAHSAFAPAVQGVLLPGVAGLLALALHRAWFRAGRIVLTWHAAGHWVIEDAGSATEVRDWWAPWVHPRAVLLCWRTGRWRTRSLLLCADALPPPQHRALRVALHARQASVRGV